MHNVVHASKLWKYVSDPARPAKVPDPVLLEDAEYFEVQDILSVRGKPDNRHYLVQWKGQDCMYSTWEPERNLSMCEELLAEFGKRRTKRSVDATCYQLRILPRCVVGSPVPGLIAHLLRAPYGAPER